MSHRFTVKEGQRYAQRTSAQSSVTVWKVGSVYRQAVAIPHARLINIDDPLRIKTISCSTLADHAFYELLGDAAQPAAG